MSELNTKTLSELTTVETLADTDTVLIESDGRMKKVSPSAIGGGGGSANVVLARGQIALLPEPETPINVQLDKTYGEIVSADYSIIYLYAKSDEAEEGFYIPLLRRTGNPETNEYIIEHALKIPDSTDVYYVNVSSGECTFTIVELT